LKRPLRGAGGTEFFSLFGQVSWSALTSPLTRGEGERGGKVSLEGTSLQVTGEKKKGEGKDLTLPTEEEKVLNYRSKVPCCAPLTAWKRGGKKV